MLDSLVRVSRRDVEKHFVRVVPTHDIKHSASTVKNLSHAEASLTRDQTELPSPTLLPNGSFSAISGTISLSFQSAFHLSLTVLVRYWFPTHI